MAIPSLAQQKMKMRPGFKITKVSRLKRGDEVGGAAKTLAQPQFVSQLVANFMPNFHYVTRQLCSRTVLSTPKSLYLPVPLKPRTNIEFRVKPVQANLDSQSTIRPQVLQPDSADEFGLLTINSPLFHVSCHYNLITYTDHLQV